MKTKFYWLALLASAAMIAQANAGGHHGGGGGGAGNVIAAAPPSSRSGGTSHVGPVPTRTFNGGRMIYYSGQRFSSVGHPPLGTFHSYYSNRRSDRFEAGTMNRAHDSRLDNSGGRTAKNARPDSSSQLRNEHLPTAWRNRVVAQHSANWHRDWDRQSDHWWHGHRCHFFNGSWIVFDLGFYPWWPYWYPYDYYSYYSYPYGYTPGYYYGSGAYEGEEYYDQNNYDVTVQSADSIVANAQEELAQQGYYHGGIDGILGPETSRAIARFQSNQRLRVTGALTRATVEALGLRQVAVN